MLSATKKVYDKQNKFPVGMPTLRGLGVRGCRSFFKNIANGWWDCKEATADWWDLLGQEREEDDSEVFDIFWVKPFFGTLGSPQPLPEYPTPWRFAALETLGSDLAEYLGGERC
ncbi:hypothetical protein [Adonisia turfae]|uniref:hypothetical protein n=1 Tax=Adonisia turfae TaxID=2950184 RepID=UPI002029A9AD|nr:hypothetical protein [Adonisia turfae]